MLKKYCLSIATILLLSSITYAETATDIAVESIRIANSNSIKSHINLPLISDDGRTTFSWASSDSATINPFSSTGYNNTVKTPPGTVTRSSEDKKVTLTVTAQNGNEIASRAIEVTVKAMPKLTKYVGYLYAYFSAVKNKNEVQQIHFAISDDGIRWRDLNENKPVLTSILGDNGVRDPYIIRSPQGDHFYLIATDLEIYSAKYGGNWGLMATKGSTSLMVWESDDLINWSNQRMVNIAGSINAGNAWAPEAIFDEKTNEYLVYWSSRVANDNYSKHRIYVSKTRDFTHFTSPQIYVESEKGNIDASMIKTNGKFYRLIKDDTDLFVSLSSSNQLLDYSNSTALGNSFTHIENTKMEAFKGGYEGSTMFKFIGENRWCVLIDEYVNAARGYIPFFSTQIDAVNSLVLADDGTYLMPTGAKHGTVIPITTDEYNNLTQKWSVKTTYPDSKNDPIAYYDFNNWQSSNYVTDLSQNNNDAQLYGNATVITDADKGEVLFLDGTNNTYFAFPKGMFDGLDSLTFSMDIKPQSQQNYHFVLGIGQNEYKYALLRIRADEVRFATTTESYLKEQGIVANGNFYNQWMNLKIIKSGHDTKVYINNKLVGENNFMRNISDLGSDLLAYIGKSFYNGDPYFKGYFDNIMVYNRCLSETEIVNAIQPNFSAKPLPSLINRTADKSLTIRIPDPLSTLNMMIFSSDGKMVASKEIKKNNFSTSIDTSYLHNGVYLLTLSSSYNTSSFKFMVNHL